MYRTLSRNVLILALGVSLSGCGGFGGSFGGSGRSSGNIGPSPQVAAANAERNPSDGAQAVALGEGTGPNQETIWDVFLSPDQNINVRVNKYLWNAALETLNFLPVEAADPFTGVMVLGWGRAPGSSRQYRATVLVQDPALDARSLKLSIQTKGGPASAETTRRIEDAILTRARQLRIRDNNL